MHGLYDNFGRFLVSNNDTTEEQKKTMAAAPVLRDALKVVQEWLLMSDGGDEISKRVGIALEKAGG